MFGAAIFCVDIVAVAVGSQGVGESIAGNKRIEQSGDDYAREKKKIPKVAFGYRNICINENAYYADNQPPAGKQGIEKRVF